MKKGSGKIEFIILIVSAYLILYPSFSAFSQEYPVREYGVKDGLPQSQTSSIFQDSRGFIWVLTRNGLSKFDGIEFVNYFRQDGLPSNSISQIFEDRSRLLWALSNRGLAKYNGTGFLFFPPGPEFNNQDFTGPVISSEIPGRYYIVSRNKMNQKSSLNVFENGIYTNYSSHFPVLDTFKISIAYYDSTNSDLLIVDSLGYKWAWKDEILTRLPLDKDLKITPDRGRMLLWNSDTIFEYRSRRKFPHFSENSIGRAEVQINFPIADRKVKYFDGSKTITVKLPGYPSGPYIDSEGVLWFPSESNMFRLLSTSFSLFTDDMIKSINLWAICRDNAQNLWLGSLDGDLFQYDGTSFRKRDEYKECFSGVTAFFKGSRLLSNGEMWLSLNRGVLIWDGKKFRRLEGIPESGQVCYIYEDPDDHKLILGTNIGVYVVAGDEIKCFPGFSYSDYGVVEGIVKDDSGFYWMSGHKGLYKFDLVKVEKIVDPILPESYTYTIEKDSYGGIWVSSDEGLFCKRPSDTNFRHGLPFLLNKPANVVKIIDKNHLLVGRGGDICLIDLESYYRDEKDYFRVYDKTDGFLGGDCLDNGIIEYKPGLILILTSDGIVRFDPGNLKKNIFPPRTWITGLNYETDSLSWEPVRMNEFYSDISEGIVLKRNQNKIRITFTGISTHNPEKVTYTYKLEGLEKKWSLPSGKREATYDNLPHGQYTFLLKAINADGVENTESVALKFRIKPSIPETKVFIFLSILFSAAFTILLTRYIIKRNQKQREEKQRVRSELSKLQINAVLKELDPHFTFNAISSIGYLILKGRRQEAYNYLTRLSSLLRTILYDGTSISRPISEELEFVRNYCELQKLRFEGRFTFNILLAENVETQREVPKMAVQIFVENSLKHGFSSTMKGGIVDILISQEAGLIKIIIRDNGIGRAASLKLNTSGSGHGIKTVKRIFGIMNHYNIEKASVDIIDLKNDGIPSGTEVIIRIPVNYNFTTG